MRMLDEFDATRLRYRSDNWKQIGITAEIDKDRRDVRESERLQTVRQMTEMPLTKADARGDDVHARYAERRSAMPNSFGEHAWTSTRPGRLRAHSSGAVKRASCAMIVSARAMSGTSRSE